MDAELPRGINSPMNGLRCTREGRFPSERQRERLMYVLLDAGLWQGIEFGALDRVNDPMFLGI